ncbi:hypothetical protein F5B21DRAFT_132845 [Xylaria acuta]|nr:hypothetical protein F5B21DRAFT_132845 [Xylaria acuta]
MCTGIVHVYRCQQCNAVVYRLKEAAKGYTCYQARQNRRRGVCRTGIDYSHYDRLSEECCLFCEIYLGGEVSDLTAEICVQGGEPWPEDREDCGAQDDLNYYERNTILRGISLELALAERCRVEDKDTLRNHMDEAEQEDAEDKYEQGKEEDDDDDDDDDDDEEEEGGAKVH